MENNKNYLENLIVQYVDEMDSIDVIRECTMNQLFSVALSMNNMGYYEGYKVEYLINNMIGLYSATIDIIEDSYKVHLIEAWDYDIKDIFKYKDKENDSTSSVFEYIKNEQRTKKEYTNNELITLQELYIKEIYNIFESNIISSDKNNRNTLCNNVLKDLESIKSAVAVNDNINEQLIAKYNNVINNILKHIHDKTSNEEIKQNIVLLQLLSINPSLEYIIKPDCMNFIR